MKTKAKIIFGLYDLTAKTDSSLNTENKQEFSILEELRKDLVKETKYATLEKNYFNLDGSKILLNTEIEGIGLCSKSMSDNLGNFTNPPTLTINFNNTHSSNGITFQFSEDNYCNDLNIKFYRNTTLLENVNFYPNSSTYFCDKIVQKYNKVIITFNKTNNPYRYLKLINIVYGQNKVFETDEIMSANILEEIDLLSSEISINTLEFSIYSKDESFNMLNPKGIYKLLQSRQMFKVFETNDDKELDMGTFYLDEWKNETECISNMKATDLIGVMDKTTFYGGMYFDTPVIDILSEIFDSAKIIMDNQEQVIIQQELKQITLSGYIPICTHREALQQVLFVIGAVADCSRSDKIKIYKINEQGISQIPYSRKNQDTESIELSDIVTGVEVTSHKYLYNDDNKIYSEQEELFNNELEIGEHFIKFSEPVYGVSLMGATVIDVNCNFVKINVITKGTIKITGYKYKHITQVYESKLENLVDSDKENILQVTNATLISNENANQIADRILNYYQNTYKMDIDFKIEDEEVGNTAIVDTLYNQKLKGTINRLDIDLTGGFIAKSTITGSLYEEEENEDIDI